MILSAGSSMTRINGSARSAAGGGPGLPARQLRRQQLEQAALGGPAAILADHHFEVGMGRVAQRVDAGDQIIRIAKTNDADGNVTVHERCPNSKR